MSNLILPGACVITLGGCGAFCIHVKKKNASVTDVVSFVGAIPPDVVSVGLYVWASTCSQYFQGDTEII